MKIKKILNEVLDFAQIEGQFKEVSKHLVNNQKDSNSLQTDLETFLRNLKAASDADAVKDGERENKIKELEKQIENITSEVHKGKTPAMQAQPTPAVNVGAGSTSHF